MNFEAFSKSNPVAEAYLRMLAEEETKNYPFKKKDKSDSDDDKEEKSKKTDDSESDDKEKSDDSEKSDGSQKPNSDKDQDSDGDEDEIGDKDAVANQAVADASISADTVNPGRPEWVPDTVADEDLSTFINAVATALEQDKTQFSWGGRYFLIQRKTEADLSTELDPNVDPNEEDANSAKNKQQNFGENVEFTATCILEDSKIQDKSEYRKSVKSRFGVNATFHRDLNESSVISYHGKKPALQKALVEYYGSKDAAKEFHPKLLEDFHLTEALDKILSEVAVGKGDDGYDIVARHAWDLSKKAHNGGTADDHHLAKHIHRHAVSILSYRYGAGYEKQPAHHAEIAKHDKALGLKESVDEGVNSEKAHIAKMLGPKYRKLKAGSKEHSETYDAVYGKTPAKKHSLEHGKGSINLELHHLDSKKIVTSHYDDAGGGTEPSVYVKESAEADVQTQKILDMHKKILKVIERPDEQKQDGSDKAPQANPHTHH